LKELLWRDTKATQQMLGRKWWMGSGLSHNRLTTIYYKY